MPRYLRGERGLGVGHGVAPRIAAQPARRARRKPRRFRLGRVRRRGRWVEHAPLEGQQSSFAAARTSL